MTGAEQAARDAADRRAMTRALDLARRGPRGLNPQVGAVLLSAAGEIIAEGWHRGAGTPHAEVDALSKASPDAARSGEEGEGEEGGSAGGGDPLAEFATNLNASAKEGRISACASFRALRT